MALPDEEKQRADTLLSGLCEQKTAQHVGEQVSFTYGISGNKATLLESRPFFVDPREWNHVKVAQFEYNPALEIWTLYWYDRKNRRQPYPTGRNRDLLDKLVTEVIKDPTGIFWE